MSSILEALKKLEKEKGESSLPPVTEITPQGDVTVQDPIVTPPRRGYAPRPARERDQLMARWISAAIIIGAAVIGLFLMLGLLGSSFLAARSGASKPIEVARTYQETRSPQIQPIVLPPVSAPGRSGDPRSQDAMPLVSAPVVPVQQVVESPATAPRVPPDRLQTYLQASTKAERIPKRPAPPATQAGSTPPARPVEMVPIPTPRTTKENVVPGGGRNPAVGGGRNPAVVPDKRPVNTLESIPMPERFPVPGAEVAQAEIETVPATKTPGTPSPETTLENPVPPERVVEPPKKPGPVEPSVDLSALPGLNEGDRARWGLAGLQVNMPLPANKNRPIASAIINMKTIRVGERIPNSKAVLIAVDMRNIGIKIEETNQRFRVRF